jgi:hypothetical protein
MKPKNDVLTLIFLIIGLIAAADLVFVQMRQQQNERNAREKLDCVVQVVEGAQATTGYNAIRDRALLEYLATGNSTNLRVILTAPPPPLSDCEIAWNK